MNLLETKTYVSLVSTTRKNWEQSSFEEQIFCCLCLLGFLLNSLDFIDLSFTSEGMVGHIGYALLSLALLGLLLVTLARLSRNSQRFYHLMLILNCLCIFYTIGDYVLASRVSDPSQGAKCTDSSCSSAFE